MMFYIFVSSSALLPRVPHRAHMVHQLLVLHETPATEMTSACVPGDGAQHGVGGVGQQGRAAPLCKIVRRAG